MNKASIKTNYIYNVTYQILILLTPLITTPYVSRVLGADGIGTYSFANSIVQYFVLFATMGLSTYGQREISYLQDQCEQRSLVFWEDKVLSFITTIVCLVIYGIFISFYGKNKIIYCILSINILNVAADITWFFQGMEEFKKIVIRNTILKILDILFIFTFVKDKNDLPLYVFGLVFFIILGNISLWSYLPQYINKVNIKYIKPFKNIRTIWSLFIPTIAIQVYTVLDKTMIGIFVEGSFENGYYEQAMKISKMVLTLVTALGSVMIPRIGHLFEKKDNKQIETYMYRAYNFVWFLAIPLCLGLIGISDNFVPWFFGNGYEKVADLLKVSGFLIVAIGINNVTGMQYLIPTKRQHVFSFTVICGAIINFIFNIILINFFQSYGAVIASVLAETTIALVQLYLVRKELIFSKIVNISRNYLISGIIMLCVLLYMNRILSASFINTSIMIIVGMCCYSIILILLHDAFFITNLKRVLEKIVKPLHFRN